MTPDIERVLSACQSDVDWFISVFEGGGDDERFQKPLERFHKLRARLDLLQSHMGIALQAAQQQGSNSDGLDALKAEINSVASQQQAKLEEVDVKVSEISKYLSDSALEEIFRALLKAAS